MLILGVYFFKFPIAITLEHQFERQTNFIRINVEDKNQKVSLLNF